MLTGPERDCGSSLLTTLRQPIASSIVIVEWSNKDSIERAICLYFLGDAAKELLDSSLLAIGVVAKLHQLLEHSVETKSKPGFPTPCDVPAAWTCWCDRCRRVLQ